MGLRKQPPPRLENLTKSTSRSKARSPTSPSNSSSSHRPGRLNHFPSEDPIYSPDLNTSPAFDLMPLEEAQRSPVGSPASHPPNSWPDHPRSDPSHPRQNQYDQYAGTSYDTTTSPWVPPELMAGQHTGASENVWRSNNTGDASAGELPVPLQSNNPFLKSRPAEQTQDLLDRNEWGRDSQASNSEPLGQTEGYIPMTARLSLLDEPEQNSPWNETLHNDQRPVLDGHHLDNNSPWGSQQSIKVSAPQDIYAQDESNPYAPAVVVQQSEPSWGTEYDRTNHTQSTHTGRLGSDAGINTPSVTLSTATSATSHELIDLEDADPSKHLGYETGSRAASSVYSSEALAKGEKPMDTGTQNPMSTTAQSGLAVEKQLQPQPSPVLSDAEAARQMEQRSETYTIRHVRWTDSTGELVESPILVQNQNGPCPLLALINALVLRADRKVQPPIVRALSSREQISLGLLIEAMFEELTTCLGPDEEFPDIEALAQFLTMLHTGMNVNPRLTLESTDGFGCFRETTDLRLYSTFGVPLIHGWVASWSSPTHAAMTRTAQYHEDIQLLPFRRQDFEERVTRGESLTFEEESTMEDIQNIQRFVEVDNATQLSPFGLTQLSTILIPGSVSILFRNDHFATLYKHPQSHQLYTLVTDAGYASHAEVVWESLVDVTGFNTEYLSGDFRPVGAGPSAPSPVAAPRTSSAAASPAEDASGSSEPSQEQSDADYAYALSLQFQEEAQRENDSNPNPPLPDRRASARHSSSSRPTPSPRMSNVPNRSSSVLNGAGPQPNPPPREIDPDDPNAPPPPYEQAAGGPRYSPPDRRSYGGAANQYPGNRNSRSQYPAHPHRSRPSVSSGTDRMNRDRNKDCIVM
ncbi:uncharacterized protein N7511_000045 [Penicillium nucicola]|uniref:uncharacterized protein n=1 Tax=Penicillium nucicola TaxID=1850975 RepID=UPI002545B1DB|nr:uncharacterized protein N7511_000045 [Penicillium nucicola]KAJ5775034.1 hypothetical protein N7511_000045 [Penicillium nucicola]